MNLVSLYNKIINKLNEYQLSSDNSLGTSSKNVVGAINELKNGQDTINKRVNTLNNGSTVLLTSKINERQVGSYSTFVGIKETTSQITGGSNTVIGYDAGRSLSSGGHNCFLGVNSGRGVTTGERNVFVGKDAGKQLNGSNNTIIGNQAGLNITSATNVTCIGQGAGGSGTVSNAVYIGNSSVSSVFIPVNPSVTCDERLKENIVRADTGICYDIVKGLPVKRFNYKKEFKPNEIDRTKTGFIAQDVQQFFKNSVVKGSEFIRQLDENDNPITITTYGEDGDEVVQEVGYTIDDALHLNDDQLLPTLWGAVQQLIGIVEEQQKQINELKGE